jgi:hypothetical protein
VDKDEPLKPLPEELFDPKSPEYHDVLNQMREYLLKLGFRVPRKPARETTLRVYLDDEHDYPLLNPWLHAVPTSDDDDEGDVQSVDPVIAVAVLTKSGDSALDEKLATFEADDLSWFAAVDGEPRQRTYWLHGHFGIAISFKEDASGREVIDFPRVVAAWRRIRRHLLD